MNIGKTIPIVIGAVVVLLAGLYLLGESNNTPTTAVPSPLPWPPVLQGLKEEVDAAGAIASWDFSSRGSVEQRLKELDQIREQIESDVEGGSINDSDHSMMTSYYQNMLADQLDKGIRQFFREVSYDKRGTLYPIYKVYKEMPQRKDQDSAFPLALQYYIVSGILRKDLGSGVDSIDLESATAHMKKVERARSYPELAGSSVFQELENRTKNSIGEKTMVTYKGKADRFFKSEFDEAKSTALKTDLNKLRNSVIGKMKIVASFIKKTENDLGIFRDCPALLANQDTLTLCQFCKPFAYYKSLCEK
jgi:hypothetical protein